MIRQKISTTEKNSEQYKKLLETIAGIGDVYVTIGVHEGAGKYQGPNAPDVVEVALWNEFGTQSGGVKVAGKRVGGTEHTPERSFIRSTIDENAAMLEKLRVKMIDDILSGKRTVAQALEAVGFQIMTLIQNKIKSNVGPANAPSTAKAKEKAGVPQITLMNSQLMLRSITYKVVSK